MDIRYQLILNKIHQFLRMSSMSIVALDGSAIVWQEIILATTLSKQVYRKHIEIVVKDAKQEVYITGNQKSLGMWNPGLIKLKHINDSIRAIDVDLHLPALFKFTLGSWKYEAGFENSYYGDNLEINNTERKNYRYILTEWMNIEDDENQ